MKWIRAYAVKAFLRGGLILLGLPRFLSILRSLKWLHRLKNRLPRPDHLNCLETSLIEIAISAGPEKNAPLAIGVKKIDGRLAAHAWLEKPGHTQTEVDGYKKLGAL